MYAGDTGSNEQGGALENNRWYHLCWAVDSEDRTMTALREAAANKAEEAQGLGRNLLKRFVRGLRNIETNAKANGVRVDATYVVKFRVYYGPGTEHTDFGPGLEGARTIDFCPSLPPGCLPAADAPQPVWMT